MKKHARVLSLLMTLVLALGLLPMAAFAASLPKAYDVSFQLKDGTVIAEYDEVSYVKSVTVPAYREVETWYCEALNMKVATGETVPADFGKDKNVVFVADKILPESFTLNFCLPNGFKAGSAVLDPNNILRLFTVPTVDGASVNWAADKDWTADKVTRVTLASGQMITGQDLDLDYDWYEKNPVLNFDLTSEAVQPDAFTVKFIGNNGREQTVDVDARNFFTALTVPAGMWFCPRQNATVGEGDYISGQTLDLDYTWYSSHPVVEFYAN